MRRIKLKIHDPDRVMDEIPFFGCLEGYDDDPEFYLNINEGDLPPRMPTFTYEVIE